MKVVEYEIKTDLNSSYVIALVSDLHSNPGFQAIDSIIIRKPDIICITGDFVNTGLKDWPDSIEFLRKCISVSKTYLSLGNHDYLITKDDMAYMINMGVSVLNDEWEEYNNEIIIGGLTSAFYHKCEKYDPKEKMDIEANVEWLEEFEKKEKFKILMDHHPENYELYTKKKNINLILSGHNHGGQIRLFGKGVFARNQGFFPKYDGGVFDNKLIVSRGLSNTIPIPRLFNPIELAYITLIPR